MIEIYNNNNRYIYIIEIIVGRYRLEIDMVEKNEEGLLLEIDILPPTLFIIITYI